MPWFFYMEFGSVFYGSGFSLPLCFVYIPQRFAISVVLLVLVINSCPHLHYLSMRDSFDVVLHGGVLLYLLAMLSYRQMSCLLHTSDYSQFALVGSGVQRKVDRLTLGVQTVYGHVLPELSLRYQDAVRERMHRVDPQNHVLVFDPSTELEVEVVAHSSGAVWNKADGVDRVVATMGDSLETPGRVLVCGDTNSDLPMVRQAVARNPEGVMALFVGVNENLRESVRQLVGDVSRCCFVSCPDVIHAAMAELLNEKRATE
uniref:Trehalose-phosphatase n=1 Tax=Ascaris suum TaxID=6253 RepID=F1L9M3_ASCSU